MKTIYLAYTDRLGECEAMFDTKGNLLGGWSSNDACWRGEYFSPFMEELGIQVINIEPTEEQLNTMAKHFGEILDDDE